MPLPPEYPGVYIEELPGPHVISGVPTSVTGFVGCLQNGPVNEPVHIFSVSDFEREFGALDNTSELSFGVQQFFLNGGLEAFVVRTTTAQISDLVNALPGLDAIDVLNLLCIPDTMNLTDTDASQLITAAESYCEQRRAFFLIDVPQHDAERTTPEQIKAWLENAVAIRHTNAALFYPRPQVADPTKIPQLRTIATSGTIAGVIARTDYERGVWKPAAGADTALRGVEALEYRLNDEENRELNQLGISCLRAFDPLGNVCWGARTFIDTSQQGSDWKYIPIRRTALFIEESLTRGTKWATFGPNDESTWAEIRLNVTAFLMNLFRAGALVGITPDEAFFVKCDRTTMTQDDIDNGRLIVLVGVAPVKPAEFVIFRIQQILCTDCT